LSTSATKESNTEAKSAGEEKERDKTRGEIEVLIIVSGLLMTPLFYLWQTATTLIANQIQPIWQNYLQTQLGSNYGFNEVVALYFSPYALMFFLPIDILLWLYDITALLGVITFIFFGFALMKIDSCNVKLVRGLVQKGRTCLNMVLLFIVFFIAVHILNNTLFPFKLGLGLLTNWAAFGIALLTAITVSRLLTTYMKKAVGELDS
jgi:hypothetical protein